MSASWSPRRIAAGSLRKRGVGRDPAAVRRPQPSVQSRPAASSRAAAAATGLPPLPVQRLPPGLPRPRSRSRRPPRRHRVISAAGSTRALSAAAVSAGTVLVMSGPFSACSPARPTRSTQPSCPLLHEQGALPFSDFLRDLFVNFSSMPMSWKRLGTVEEPASRAGHDRSRRARDDRLTTTPSPCHGRRLQCPPVPGLVNFNSTSATSSESTITASTTVHALVGLVDLLRPRGGRASPPLHCPSTHRSRALVLIAIGFPSLLGCSTVTARRKPETDLAVQYTQLSPEPEHRARRRQSTRNGSRRLPAHDAAGCAAPAQGLDRVPKQNPESTSLLDDASTISFSWGPGRIDVAPASGKEWPRGRAVGDRSMGRRSRRDSTGLPPR